MSIPGLGQAPAVVLTSAVAAPASSVHHELQPNSEWRFEVDHAHNVDVKVLSGTAELFGTELALNRVYAFRGTKASIFTWHGCRLEVTGVSDDYTAEETPMVVYTNTHFALEAMRYEASRTGKDGPRVLVLGPTNAGKTSLVKLLTAYAVRGGRQPMVVNTDPKEGLLSIPGSLTATVLSSIIDVEEDWGSTPTSGPSAVPVKLPLCYYYGLPNPEDNMRLYKALITRMSLAATSRLNDDAVVKKTGVIIDTTGLISQGKNGYDIIAHMVSDFSVNVILYLGSERLYNDMQRRFNTYKIRTGEDISIVKLDKSGGCVDRDEAFMHSSRDALVREYFFGNSKRTLSPHTQHVNFDDLTIYKVNDVTNQDGNFNGEDSNVSSYEKVDPSSEMLHCFLAAVYATEKDTMEAIRDASVMGYVYVAEVDEKRRRLRILAPVNTRISDRPMIWGSWPEASMNLLT